MKNLTPHAITLSLPDGSQITFPPSGELARVTTVDTKVGVHETGVPVVSRAFGEVVGLPEHDEPCIVSAMVLDAIKAKGSGRVYVFAPDSGPTAIRNEAGHIDAVTRLVCN